MVPQEFPKLLKVSRINIFLVYLLQGTSLVKVSTLWEEQGSQTVYTTSCLFKVLYNNKKGGEDLSPKVCRYELTAQIIFGLERITLLLSPTYPHSTTIRMLTCQYLKRICLAN